jgi:hypothetical protein
MSCAFGQLVLVMPWEISFFFYCVFSSTSYYLSFSLLYSNSTYTQWCILHTGFGISTFTVFLFFRPVIYYFEVYYCLQDDSFLSNDGSYVHSIEFGNISVRRIYTFSFRFHITDFYHWPMLRCPNAVPMMLLHILLICGCGCCCVMPNTVIYGPSIVQVNDAVRLVSAPMKWLNCRKPIIDKPHNKNFPRNKNDKSPKNGK